MTNTERDQGIRLPEPGIPMPGPDTDRWTGRNQMICQTCMYFMPKNLDLGRCRRHAPTMKGWPVLFNSDWCGDHKLDEYKITPFREQPDDAL